MFVTEITPTKTARVELSLDATSPLPDSYGDDRLVMIARDPNTFFAYWEITPERTEHIRSIHGPDSWENAALVLRVYDLGVAQKTPIDSASHLMPTSIPICGRGMSRSQKQAISIVPT